jgi:Flp pilus assembly protein TadD
VLVATSACLPRHTGGQRAGEENAACVRELHAGNLEKARFHCEHGLKFAPDDGDLLTNLGLIELREQHLRRAKDLFIQALRSNPNQMQALNNLGKIYLEEGSHDEAIKMFRSALRVSPDYLEAMNNLAYAYFLKGDLSQAKKHYRELAYLAPTLAMPRHDLGIIALKEQRYRDAVCELRASLQLSPDHPGAWLHLGVAYSELADFERATSAFEECVSLDAKHEQCLNNLRLTQRKSKLQGRMRPPDDVSCPSPLATDHPLSGESPSY